MPFRAISENITPEGTRRALQTIGAIIAIVSAVIRIILEMTESHER